MGCAIWSLWWLHLISYLEPLTPFKKLYGATHFFRLVAPFCRLFGATQSFLGGGSIEKAIWSHQNIGSSCLDILRPYSGHVTDSRDLTKVADAGKKKLNLFVFLLCVMPAPSSECQHPEAWPASTYGHLREWYIRMKSSFH